MWEVNHLSPISMAADFFTSSWGPCWIVLIVIVGIEIAAKRKTRWSVSTRGRVTGSLHDALRGATYLSVPPPPVRAKAHHYCSRRYAISKFMPPHHKHSAQANTEDKKRTTISDTCYFINIIRDTLVNRLHDSQRNCCTYRQWCGWAEGISNGEGIDTQVQWKQIPRELVVQYLVQRVRFAILLLQCILFHY